MDKEKVAVIAVHGVGDPSAGDTSLRIIRQLQHFHPQRFGQFSCTPVHIAVDTRELYFPPQPDTAAPAVQPTLPYGMRARARTATPEREGTRSADLAFTAMTLAGGEDYRGSYTTTRLRKEGHAGGHTDVYEMFWADLSHVGTSGWKVLQQMMQLFLHMASLGRTALATQLANWPKPGAPRALSAAYGAAAASYWLLAVPIMLGNLLLLCYGVAFLGLLVPPTGAGQDGTALAFAAAVGALLGWAVRTQMRRPAPPAWIDRGGLPLAWLGATGTAVAGLSSWPDGLAPSTVAFAMALALALAAATWFVHGHERVRPGVIGCWRAMLAAAFLWGMAIWFGPAGFGPPTSLAGWFIYLVEGTFLLLIVAWTVLALSNLCLLAAGTLATRGRDGATAQPPVTTALIAAALPAPLLLFAVLAVWLAALHAIKSTGAPLLDTPALPGLFGDDPMSLAARFKLLIDLSASPAAVPYLVLLILAFACAVLAIVPSVLAEVAPPDRPGDPAASRGLWRWLDGGFRLMGLAKWLVVAGFFIVLPSAAVLQYIETPTALDGFRASFVARFPGALRNVSDLAQYLNFTVGGGALALAILPRLLGAISFGKLSQTFARLRVVVDTAIDVDNWLRERPVGDTPRLHIMARYVSLLRYVRDLGYDRVVLVCHSQGAVITLDLLRYLKGNDSTLLQDLKRIDLLTVGAPIRQLYAARFPAIYGWANLPDPAAAGLASWRNGYGSGDYVGRNLWPDTGQDPWTPGPVGAQEFCTGALAHTRYFDRYSRDVADAIAGLAEGQGGEPYPIADQMRDQEQCGRQSAA